MGVTTLCISAVYCDQYFDKELTKCSLQIVLQSLGAGGLSVLVNPICRALDRSQESFHSASLCLSAKNLQIPYFTSEAIEDLYVFLLGLIFGGKRLRFLGRVLDILLRETTLRIQDCDRFRPVSAAVQINDVSVITKIKCIQTHVPLTTALTFITPFPSTSNVTSI